MHIRGIIAIMLNLIARCFLHLAFLFAHLGRKRRLEVKRIVAGKVPPSVNDIMNLSNTVAARRWLAGLHYGDSFVYHAGVGRHGFNQMIEHMMVHLLNLYGGVPDEQGPSVSEHLGAVMVGAQILCWYVHERPYVFSPVADITNVAENRDKPAAR